MTVQITDLEEKKSKRKWGYFKRSKRHHQDALKYTLQESLEENKNKEKRRKREAEILFKGKNGWKFLKSEEADGYSVSESSNNSN